MMKEIKVDADPVINRQCNLQAKWNGTTPFEEYKAMKGKKKDSGFNTKFSTDTECAEILDKKDKRSCEFYNKFVKGITDCCDTHECNMNCPNCRVTHR